jgi:sugar O-acyltransferase (sialic acid O-acetyltransferase NeuD family)
MSAVKVLIPLVNPNEPEARLAAIHVQEKQSVEPGEVLCTLETTKSTQEVVAEHAGFVAGLSASPGDPVRAGDLFCYLADSPDWQPERATPPTEKTTGTDEEQGELPPGLRITQPALALARAAGIDLERLPHDRLVTEKVVREFLPQPAIAAAVSTAPAFNPMAIIVYGGGGHGKSVIDLLRATGAYRLVGILDDGLPPGERLLDVPILGSGDHLSALFADGVRLAVNAVGGIGDLRARLRVFERLHQAGFACPTVIHPTAFVEPTAQLATGVQVFPLAYVGSQAAIGYGAIINTNAIVSHDCQVQPYANLSPGATLAGGVQIAEQVLVGMRATINLQVEIGAGARIGNGATVKTNVPAGGIVPAGSIWPKP